MSALRHLGAMIVLCGVAVAQSAVLPPIPPLPTPVLESVTIYRDSDAWAHVFSTAEAAAYYGFGLAQMRDLPLTTARNLAIASGELAATVGAGPIGDDGIGFHTSIDLRTRLWRIDEIALQQKSSLPRDIENLLRAYAAGLNAGRFEWLLTPTQLANNTEPIAYDLTTVLRLLGRPITLDDILCHGVQVNGLTAMATAGALADSDDPFVQESQIRTASNSFAVAGESCVVPMTVADPHLGFQDIGQLRAYFTQISGGGHDVCGISFPGFPAVAIGFNADLSWTVTSNNPDFVDVWRAPTMNGATYEFDGLPRAIVREPVVIQVWDPTTNSITNTNHILSYAGGHDRPIIREELATTINGSSTATGSIWYAGSTFDTEASVWEFFIRLGRAHSVVEARQVFDMNVILAQNFLLADRTGDLGYFWSGRVPRRPAPTPGTDWSMIQDGSSSNYQWNSVHDADELPWEHARAGDLSTPDAGKWLQCNVAADLVRPGTDLNLAKFPEYMVHAQSTPMCWRQLRGRELLSSGEQLTGAALRALVIDDVDLWWRAVKPLARSVMDEFALWQYGNLTETFGRLEEWDLSTAPDRAEPLISHLIWSYYAKHMDELQNKGHPAPSYDDFSFPDQLPDLATFNSRAWRENRSGLAAALIKADQTWRTCINPVLTQLSFPTSPWTPTPFQDLPSAEAVWGTAHYIDITPQTSPASTAAYPVAGSTSLLALGNTQIKKPWETIIENVTILGQTGTLVNLPIDSGAHTMLHVELHPSGPKAWFLEAIGPSERADDPDRYRHVPDFVAGNWRRFPTKSSSLGAEARSTESLQVDLSLMTLP